MISVQLQGKYNGRQKWIGADDTRMTKGAWRARICYILYTNSIAVMRFSHSKSTDFYTVGSSTSTKNPWCQELTHHYYAFYRVSRIQIIPSVLKKIPGIFLKFTHNSRVFIVIKCNMHVILGCPGIYCGWLPLKKLP